MLVLVLLLGFSWASAQEAEQTFVVDIVTKDIRSSFGAVTQIHQDSTGQVWMGVRGKGLAYYDGRYIRRVPLREEKIFANRSEIFFPANNVLLLNMEDRVLIFDPIRVEIVDSLLLPPNMPRNGHIETLAFSTNATGASTLAAIYTNSTASDTTSQAYLLYSKNFEPFQAHPLEFLPGKNPLLQINSQSIVYKSKSGLVELDHQGEMIHHFHFPAEVDINSIFNSTTILEADGTLWITFRVEKEDKKNEDFVYGLYRYKLKKRRFTFVQPFLPLVKKLTTYRDGILVLGYFGLRFIDREGQAMYDYILEKEKFDVGVGPEIYEVHVDRFSGLLWLGCSYGLARLNPSPGGYVKYVVSAPRGIIEDSNGNLLMIGVRINGEKRDVLVSDDPFKAINSKRIWTETGFLKVDPIVQQPTFVPLPKKRDAFSIQEKDGYIFTGGLRFKMGDQESEELIPVEYVERINRSASQFNTYSLPVIQTWDRDSMLWLIKWYSDLIVIVDPNTLDIKRKIQLPQLDKQPIELNEFYRRPSDDHLWLATEGQGVFEFHPDGYLLRHLNTRPSTQGRIPSNIVSTFYEDNQGHLWMGTGVGLVRLNADGVGVQHWPIFPEQPYKNLVYGILPEGDEDDRYLWISTNNGVYRFDQQDEIFTSFPLHQDFSRMEFNRTSHYKSSDGYLHFGGIKVAASGGVFRFKPEELLKTYDDETAYYFKILINEIVKYDGELEKEIILTKGLQSLQEITLQADDRYLAVEFSSTDLRSPQNNLYTYQLEGYDLDWRPINKKNYLVRYENLPHGTYRLRLRGSLLPENLESSERVLLIHVLAPWYLRIWALALFALLSISLLFGAYRYFVQRRLREEENKRLIEFNELRARMYTNITHEFRTPLTIVLGMAEKIKGHLQEKQLIEKNGKKLLSLINQILDLSKVESGELKTNYVQGDILPLMRYLAGNVEVLASQKEIQLNVYTEDLEIIMDYDAQKMEHIVTNLLQNAVKFTPVGGSITLHLKKASVAGEAGSQLVLKVQDTGSGISAEHLPHLFDRFYQVDGPDGQNTGGTGIGLSLTKELVELLGGTIGVNSVLGKGTIFEVNLPIHRQAEAAPMPLEANANLAMFTDTNSETAISNAETTLPLVLIVEDNADIRIYIESILNTDYRIIMASDGAEGFVQAIDQTPDLIITDLMMPKLNGLQLTQKLKADAKTSHIPIIILTAKASQEDKNIGLSYQADAYLTKPFDRTELLIRMKVLVEQRRHFYERYRDLTIPTSNATAEKDYPQEDEFLQKLRQYVEDRLSDTDLNVQALCQHIGMSQSQLYRKLKALSDTSPNQFIRRIRLQKAKVLLQKTELTVAEIAYEVGFTDPNYFTRSFKQEFDQTPKSLR